MRIQKLFVAFGVALGLPALQLVHAQSLPDSAVNATTAALSYLLEADSLPDVSWPSAKSLLTRRPGSILLSGITTRIREDPGNAIALVERVIEALNARGIQARSIPERDGRVFCTSADTCRLPDNVGLLFLVGYGVFRPATGYVARITIMADSRVIPGRPTLSLDVHVEQVGGVWRVTTMNRSRGAGD